MNSTTIKVCTRLGFCFRGWVFFSLVALGGCSELNRMDDRQGARASDAIDRQAWVSRHKVQVARVDPQAALTLGNGRFAFTTDATGLQSLAQHYFAEGMPLETKARWAWHSRANPRGFTLADAGQSYPAYGRQVSFPTDMDSEAGQWLRRNPHDLPLFQAGFYLDEQALRPAQINDVDQSLDLWRGHLSSRFTLAGHGVALDSAVDSERDALALALRSPLLAQGRLSIDLRFPRGYDLSVKNTPGLIWGEAAEHRTQILEQTDRGALLLREVDDHRHLVRLSWRGAGVLKQVGAHHFRWGAAGAQAAQLVIEVSELQPGAEQRPALPAELGFAAVRARSARAWGDYWRRGAAVTFAGSTEPRAAELERRIVLSRYLLGVQTRAAMPAQETGLTSSSWYGKHHTEMTFWHSAHWALWGEPAELRRVLDWYRARLPEAQAVAAERGLMGARWPKMIGPDLRESPGGNPLIIWNQPQFIHLAELLYRRDLEAEVLEHYAELVEQSAWAIAAMLVQDPKTSRYNLEPPIWIAQEIYPPRQTRNPTFELAYFRYGLQTAQAWRERRGLPPHPQWQARIERLAPLPVKDGKYVAIESIPDTFTNRASRRDHPSMLAAFGMLADPDVDVATMGRTLDAVAASWDWQEKIWGWDYPMIAMTAARLNRPQFALDMLLADLTHNHYLGNGHVPQPGAGLPVYLPANGALLAAVAMMLGGWEGAPARANPGFPEDGRWRIRAEGFAPYPL